MQIVQGYTNTPAALRGAALAIGNFDGVHRGHQVLLGETIRRAREMKRPAAVMLFEPHPRLLFRPNEPIFALTPLPEKLRLLAALGLDATFVIAFDQGIAGLSPAAFVDNVLVGGFGVGHVVIGYDFYFGKARAGTPDTMRDLGAAHGFGVSVVAPVAEAGEVFSSSAVRARLSTGDVHGAAVELGHWWRVSGPVTGGAKRGTGMGYPTANVTLAPGTALGHGIYSVRVFVDEAGTTRRLNGAAYFGQRPTFDNGAPVLEVFLFDFEGDLYGRRIDVEFIGFVRPDQRFPNMEALVQQMDRDCEEARRQLASADADDPFKTTPLGKV